MTSDPTAPSADAAPSSSADDRAHLTLLAEISRAHFLDQKSKVQIAQDHDISRFQVAALVQEARDRGIVRITIAVPSDGRDQETAQSLGIAELISVEPAHTPRGAEALARELAASVAEHAAGQTAVGISWSRIIQAMAPHLPDLSDSVVVQLAGAIASPDSTEAVPRLLSTLRAKQTLPLWAPLVAGEGAAALRETPEIARTLAQAGDLDLAVFAIGGWGPGLSTVWDRIQEQDRQQALAAGAVAEISGHLIDARGTAVEGPVEDSVIAASLADLRAARRRIAVAHGAGRAPAVLAAVRAGLVDILVCDIPLRDALAELEGQ